MNKIPIASTERSPSEPLHKNYPKTLKYHIAVQSISPKQSSFDSQKLHPSQNWYQTDRKNLRSQGMDSVHPKTCAVRSYMQKTCKNLHFPTKKIYKNIFHHQIRAPDSFPEQYGVPRTYSVKKNFKKKILQYSNQLQKN